MPNIVFQDNEKGITISLIKNYDEAKNVPCFNTWCVFNSSDYWLTHKQDGDTIYLMRFVEGYRSSFFSVRVERNGRRHYYAYDHTKLSDSGDEKYPSVPEIEQTIGEGGVDVLIPRIINESKTNKNMKKNVVKLNESQLRKVVAESVKRVLSEIDFHDGYNSVPGEGMEDDNRTDYERCREILERACEYAGMGEQAYKKGDIDNFHMRFEMVWRSLSSALDALGGEEPNW